MNFLCYTVVKISPMKDMERIKKNKYREEQIEDNPFSTPRYNLSLSTCIQNMKFLSYIVLEISLKKKYTTEAWRERKVNIYREEQTGEGRFFIPQDNLSLSTCLQNMNFLCYAVVEISLTKI